MRTIVIVAFFSLVGLFVGPALATAPCVHGLSKILYDVQHISQGGVKSGDLSYPTGTFWHEDGKYFGCPCLVTACLRKCCSFGQVMSDNDAACVRDPLEGEVPLRLNVWDGDESGIVYAAEKFAIIAGESTCKTALVFQPDQTQIFKIYENGSLVINGLEGEHGAGHFCVDYHEQAQGVHIAICEEAFEGHELKNALQESKIFIVYPILMMVSCLFLAATVLTYLLVPEMRNLHGNSVVSYSISLIFGYLALIILQLTGRDSHITVCVISAFSAQFGLLSAFFWLNVMSFEVWRFFSGLRTNLLRSSSEKSERKKYRIYCLYAWGVPFLIFIITLIMQSIPNDPDLIQPRFGYKTCWFHDKPSTFLYFYGPIAILLSMNLLFFVSTTVKIMEYKRDIKEKECEINLLEFEDHIKKKSVFKLYLKLFLLMGISWIMEIISWLVEGPMHYWYITDAFNLLQGVFIFALFVCGKRAVRLTLAKKLCPNLFPPPGHNDCQYPTQPSNHSYDNNGLVLDELQQT